MPKKLYKMVGVGKQWDGYLAEVGDQEVYDMDKGRYLNIVSLLFPDSTVGDRELSMPFSPGALFIEERFLHSVPERKPREFDSTKPFGKAMFEGRFQSGTLEVAWCRFELALQVSVLEKVEGKLRTRYSEYFFGDNQHQSDVLQEISIAVQKEDLDDLMFTLEGLKGSETVNTKQDVMTNGGKG